MSSRYFRNHVNCDGSSYPRDAAAQAPPTVLQREVAAPAGCRTVVTQSCRRVPRAVTRKLPEEECEQVPDTVCHTRLEKVGSQRRRHQYGRYGNCHTWGFTHFQNR